MNHHRAKKIIHYLYSIQQIYTKNLLYLYSFFFFQNIWKTTYIAQNRRKSRKGIYEMVFTDEIVFVFMKLMYCVSSLNLMV